MLLESTCTQHAADPDRCPQTQCVCSLEFADVSGENFDAAINAELHKISTFYIDKEEEFDVRCTAMSAR
jgi:hypothetical protein